MLHFFRQIRRHLISESKISKYLIYAIGEIILVVIGILIALQINLWKEQQEERSMECVYLNSLLNDLEDQIQIIEAQMKFETEVIKDGELLLSSYNETNSFIVGEEFSKRIGTLNNRRTFNGSASTFQELLSTGNTSIISDQEVKNNVLKYYQKLKQFEDIISKNNSYIDNHFAPIALELSVHSTPNLQINLFQNIISKGLISADLKEKNSDVSYLYDRIQRHLDQPLKKLKLLNDIRYRYRISGVHLSLMDDLKTQSENIIEILQNELTNCEL